MFKSNRFVSKIALRSLGDVLGPLRHLGRCAGCRDQFMSTAERVLPTHDGVFCVVCAPIAESGFATCAARLGVEHVDADRDCLIAHTAFESGYRLAFNAHHGGLFEQQIAENSGLKSAYAPRDGWGF